MASSRCDVRVRPCSGEMEDQKLVERVAEMSSHEVSGWDGWHTLSPYQSINQSQQHSAIVGVSDVTISSQSDH